MWIILMILMFGIPWAVGKLSNNENSWGWAFFVVLPICMVVFMTIGALIYA